ncbi:MAG: PPC domain-containing protein [Verrucomicrobiales bacterium]|nr:PPC domain-containing protein [Verrucomicrobiales bacterium]
MAVMFLTSVTVQAASPDLRTTVPRGGQRGKEVKVIFSGLRLDGAQEVLFHQKGMSFKDLKVLVDVARVKAKAAFELAGKNATAAEAATKAAEAKKVAAAKAALDAATKKDTPPTPPTTAAKNKAKAAFDLANKNAAKVVAATKAAQAKKVAAAKAAMDKANKAPANRVEATLVIAPDCELGEHHIRLRTTSGMSYARTFWVSQFPTVEEVEPNDDFAKPQEVALNVTVEGAAKPEEVDYYRIKAKKGQRISVEVEGMRINDSKAGNIMIDPYVAILDDKRFELAVSDDSALLKQDSVTSIIAPKDGAYTIEVRDSAYQGRGRYRVHIGTFPRPLGVYPAGGKAGSDLEVTLLGDQKGDYKTKVKLPADGKDAVAVFGIQEGLLPPSGNELRVAKYDNVLEKEPNNSSKEASPGAALPLAFNGILQEPGDTDYFKFTAKKGQKYRFRSYANRIGTPVDTVIYIYDAKGKQVGTNDDADGSSDSRLDFKAAADGEYTLRVRDMLDRGGKDYVYRIETEAATPNVVVTIPDQIRRDSQFRRQFDIPKGNHFAMVVNVSRQNYSGELQFDLPKLPKGVTWEAGTIPKNLSQFPIILHAAADAPIAGALYHLYVKNVDPKTPVRGIYKQDLDIIRGNPNNITYYSSPSNWLAVGVVEEAPFSISIDQPAVPIVRNGTMKLKVRVKRKKGFEKAVLLRMLWRPPGIGCPSTVTIPAKKNEVEYELNANAKAEVKAWKLTILGEADAGKGLVTIAAPFINLAVEEPYATMKINLATVKQGDKAEVICDLAQLRPFEGKAELKLFGLPANTEFKPIEITKDTKQVVIPVETNTKTPVGKHKNIYGNIIVMKNKQPILHKVGMGGIFRVDPATKKVVAKPAAKKAAPAAKKVVAKAPAPKKPLSRLEQLRLEAKKKLEAAKK